MRLGNLDRLNANNVIDIFDGNFNLKGTFAADPNIPTERTRRKWRSLKMMKWSRHSCRIDPMTLST